jgi:hypothetical protein
VAVDRVLRGDRTKGAVMTMIEKRVPWGGMRATAVGAALFAMLSLAVDRAHAQENVQVPAGPMADPTDDPLFAEAFVGAVDDELFIGVLVAERPDEPDQKTVVVYVCDGDDVSTWLFADATGDRAVVQEGDTRLEMTLEDSGVHGLLDRAGAGPHGFVAVPASDEAGLYRAVATIEGRDYVGGWIVLNDGRQRGAITLDGAVVDNPTLDPSTQEAVSSVGTFGSNCFRNPWTGERICRYLN